MTADLHIHTTASDGQLSPLEIIEEAIRAGLTEIAITDHDTVDALLQLHAAVPTVKGQLSIIPGIEFSTDLPCCEVHILGYGIDIFDASLSAQLKRLLYARQERVQKMIVKLKSLGYSIDYNRVVELAGKAGSIGRPHVARALLEKGYFDSFSEVFSSLLEKNCPAYIPHYKMDIEAVIQLIKAAGGIAVLAHPGLIGSEEVVQEVIKAGIDGMEVYHPIHNNEQIRKYIKMAQQYKLVVTGGSDFHGTPGRYPEKLGVFTIPAALVRKLYNAQTQNRLFNV